MNYKIFSVVVSTLMICAGLTAFAENAPALDPSKLPPASTNTNVTFAKDIKPIFENSCVKCHHGEKPAGRLALDTLENSLKPGKEAQDIVVGKSDKSPLVYSVAHVGDEDDWMPKPNKRFKVIPLTKEEVGMVRAWIDQGAK